MALQVLLKKTIAKSKSRFDVRNGLSLCDAFSAVPSSPFTTSATASDVAGLPQLPPFDYEPKPYKGPLADEVFAKRKKFLGPSLFHYYQKPVSLENKSNLINFCFFFSFFSAHVKIQLKKKQIKIIPASVRLWIFVCAYILFDFFFHS